MRRKPAFASLAAVLTGTALWYWGLADNTAEAARSQAPLAVSAATNLGAGGIDPPSPPGAGGPFSAAGIATREQQLLRWQQRYTRAEAAYSSYRDATRYPPESRPLSEHLDQQRPFEPIAEEAALRDSEGKPVRGLRIRTTQGRVFLSGEESSRFSIEAVDENGRVVPLQVRRSAAQALPDSAALAAAVRVPVPFSDDGQGGDELAGDHRHSALLTPSRQGFGAHSGTIRLLAEISANGQQGTVAFDLVYLPAVPATWAGVREALEDGALNFYLKAQVTLPGRYVATARLYDAKDQPVALLQFNDTVSAGPAEFKLSLAGVLIHDQRPVFPLRLVDVEAFLLRPDAYPDRAMMPRQPGEVHRSGRYALERFSDREWQSEERERHLAEYGRDLDRARREVERLR